MQCRMAVVAETETLIFAVVLGVLVLQLFYTHW